MACKAMVRQGTCGNKVRLRRGKLEAQVLDALASDMMQPDLVAAFVASFTTEWNRLSNAASSGVADKQRELEGVERKLSRLIDAIADGLRAQGMQGRLDEMELRKAAGGGGQAGQHRTTAAATAPQPRRGVPGSRCRNA